MKGKRMKINTQITITLTSRELDVLAGMLWDYRREASCGTDE
jgi:hypothetical protein